METVLFKKKYEVNKRLQYLYKNKSPFVEYKLMRKILWIQNYQNFSNLESSFYGSLKICYLDSSYLSVDKSQFNSCNGKEDVLLMLPSAFVNAL